MSSTFGERLIYNASQWNGCKEDKNTPNRSKCVDKIKSYFGGEPTPDPWCAEFVSMIVDETCKDFAVQNPLPATKSTHLFLANAKKSNIAVNKIATQGAVFFIDWGKRGRTKGTGHVGFTNYVEGSKINTIEGNFGDSVNFGWRSLDQIDAFIHVETLGGEKTIGSFNLASVGNGVKVATALVGGYLVWNQFLKGKF